MDRGKRKTGSGERKENGEENRVGRLIVDGPAKGGWNMAVDEALLKSTAESRQWTLRFYRWSKPVLSLGYFQNYDSRASHSESGGIDCVRRSTGGGAIVHDHELTYSLACPSSDRLSRDNEALYFIVHRAFKAALFKQIVTVDLYDDPYDDPYDDRMDAQSDATVNRVGGREGKRGDNRVEPFLCFLRRTSGDIVFGDGEREHKVCGSAQRRYRNAVLQHGSLIFNTSQSAPQIHGLCNLSDIEIDAAKLIHDFTGSIESEIGVAFEPDELNSAESHQAHECVQAKFGLSDWTQRR